MTGTPDDVQVFLEVALAGQIDDACARHHHVARSELAQRGYALDHVRRNRSDGAFRTTERCEQADLLERRYRARMSRTDQARNGARHREQRPEDEDEPGHAECDRYC